MTEEGLERLLAALRDAGHTLVGPTVRDGVITLAPIDGASSLPRGVGDVQAPGSYALRERGDGARFAFASPQASFRRFLQPPVERLYRIRRGPSGPVVDAEPVTRERLAFVGIRACDLAAIAIQDRVLEGGPHIDDRYQARRAGLFTVAVACGTPSASCFCVSMGGGPVPEGGFDLLVFELLSGEHRYAIKAGSDRGREVLAALGLSASSERDVAEARQVEAQARSHMGRSLDTRGLAEALLRDLDHPRFADIASRCLACTSCTLVCPTCFCTRQVDELSLDGSSERLRAHDSCFSASHSYMHGGSVRQSTAARYRQFITHKLATWHEQFGTQGCTGCGRCITFCPAGIDITREAAAIAGSDRGSP